MYKKILIFFFLINACKCLELTDKVCNTLLRELADSHQRFMYCTTAHAVPIRICHACISEFDDVVAHYIPLKENCSKEYFDNDRINIIEATQTTLVGIWNKAYCGDCYSGNHSQIFDDDLDDLTKCFDENKNKSCTACLEQYNSLNSFYLKMYTQSNSHVCFDLQDAMNRTRAKWSNEFHCGQHNQNLVMFLCAAIAGLTLPILFYITVFIVGKRQEHNHGLLNEETDIETVAVNNVDTDAVARNIINPSNSHEEEKTISQPTKRLINVESEDDSDEEDYDSD